MPLTDAKPDALARIYARSLYELAEQQGGQKLIEDILAELEDILELARGDEKFGELLASRVLPVNRRAESLDRIFSGRAEALTVRFLQVLNAKGRLSHLPVIAAAFDDLVQERFGRIEVDVYTASPISSAELGAIRDRLRTALGKEPIVHPYTDNAMIGGIKLQIGDRLIDASVATRLRQMREKLSEEGIALVRASADRLLEDSER